MRTDHEEPKLAPATIGKILRDVALAPLASGSVGAFKRHELVVVGDVAAPDHFLPQLGDNAPLGLALRPGDPTASPGHRCGACDEHCVSDDHLQETLEYLKGIGVDVLRVELISGSKIKRLHLDRGHDPAGVMHFIHRDTTLRVAVNHVMWPGSHILFCNATDPAPADDPSSKLQHGGAGVNVALFDSGVCPNHPFFMKNKLKVTAVDGAECVVSNNTFFGHGTFSASTIFLAAADAAVKVVRTNLNSNYSDDFSLTRVIEERVVDDADVVCMPLGGPGLDAVMLGLEHALTKMAQRRLARGLSEAVVVASAGNDHDPGPTPRYPAGLPGVVSVGSLTPDLSEASSFSNSGVWVRAWSPGEDLVGAYPVGTDLGPFVSWSGTSFAAAHAAGRFAGTLATLPAGAGRAATAISQLVTSAPSGRLNAAGAILP